jgi:hypothetical protein
MSDTLGYVICGLLFMNFAMLWAIWDKLVVVIDVMRSR